MSDTTLPMPSVQHSSHDHGDDHMRPWERDPNWLAQNDVDIAEFIRDLEDGAMHHLADALILSRYTKHDEEKAIELAIRALRPLAPYSAKIKKVLDRLGEAHGSLKYQPKGNTLEDSYDTSLYVVEARLRERKELLKSLTISDLRSCRQWAAKARLAQRVKTVAITPPAARAA